MCSAENTWHFPSRSVARNHRSMVLLLRGRLCPRVREPPVAFLAMQLRAGLCCAPAEPAVRAGKCMVMAIVIRVFHVFPVYRIPDRRIDRYNSPTGSGALSRLKENDSAGISTGPGFKESRRCTRTSQSYLDIYMYLIITYIILYVGGWV
jgi:hypothetical protein